AKARSIRKLLKERGTVASSNDVTASNLIQRLREQEIALTRRLADLSTTYLSNHPRILSVRQEINDVRREIRVEALKIVEGLEQQAKVAAAREASLRASMNELKTTASVNKQDEVKLRALEREAKANREQLEALLKRLSDASARQDIYAQPARARIISRAAVPSQPSFPKRGPILMIATGGAIAIALLAAFLVEAINVGGSSSASARGHGGHPTGPQPQAPSPSPQPQPPAPARGGLFAKLKGAMKTAGPAAPHHAAAHSAPHAPHTYAHQHPAYAPQAPVAPAYPAPPQHAVPPAYAPPPQAAPQAEMPNPAWSPPPAPTPPPAPAAPARAPANPFAVDQSVMGAPAPQPPVPEVVAAPPVAPVPQTVPQPVPQAPVSVVPEPSPAPQPVPAPSQEAAPILANIADMSNDLEGLPYQVIVDPSSPFSSSVFLAARSIAERLGDLSNIRLFVAPTHEPTAGVIMSASLARAFSTFGLKTIVVDATMSGRELTAAFGVHDGPGLSEFLRGSSAFSDCIVRDGASSTHVMTSGANSSEARELAAGNRIDVTLAALSHAYDVVIMSAANLTSNPWALSIAEKTDMALLVTPAEAHDGVAAQFAETMKSAMSKDVCFVLAHAPQRHAYVA
ncbi:MAG: hypothetical protein AAGI06_17875, partial [Pseudomonadota bacterium]